MTTLLKDIQYSLRALAKNPSFALIAVLSLALGIGANTTIFSLVNSILLNPLPFDDVSELVAVYTTDETNPALGVTSLSFPNYEDYRDQNEVFDGVFAWGGFPAPASMLVGEEPEQVFVEIVTGNFFDVLGVEPAMGRFILAEEDRAEGANPVAVLSHPLWTRRFGADPSVLGRTVVMNGLSYDVIGVAKEGFKGVNALFSPDVWIPMMMYRQILPAQFHQFFEDRRALFVNVGGRLSAGVSMEEAGAQMKTIATALEAEYPEPNKGRSIELRNLSEATVFPGMRDGLVVGSAVLMVVVGLVLLVACFNVANLMMAKATARRKEIAVRLSLGSSRGRLIRQLLTESIFLGLLGGTVGLVVAYWSRDLIMALQPPFAALNLVEPAIDARVLGFTLLISVVTGALFGLFPAIQSSRPAVVDALKEEGRAAGRGNGAFSFRNALVVAQIALSIVALVAAGLFLRSLESAQEINPGFETEQLAVLTVNPGQAGYDQAQGEQFYDRILERLREEPFVTSAAWATNAPLFGGFSRTVYLEGQPRDDGARVFVTANEIDSGYFGTMGIPLLQGRDFTPADRDDSRKVAIINEATAQQFFAGIDPIGKRFEFYGDDYFREIVGIVATSKVVTLGEDPQPVIFTPRRQGFSDAMVLHVRTDGDPADALGGAQRILRETDRTVPSQNTWTIAELIDQSLFLPKMAGILLGAIGLLALTLASIGLYGVMSFNVSQRKQEIGLRMALGADQGDVLKMMIKLAMALVGVGTVIGLGGAFLVSGAVSSILYGSARDPLTFIGVPIALAIVALLATLIPAIKASRVDPLIALRYQ